MIYVAGLGAPVPSEMNNSNYESNEIVLNFPRFRALGEGPPPGGHKIFDARPAAQGSNKVNNSNYESNEIMLTFLRFRGLGRGPPPNKNMINVFLCAAPRSPEK